MGEQKIKAVTDKQILKFIKENLNYINRSSGTIEYTIYPSGNNMEQGFPRGDVVLGIRAAMVRIKEKP